MDAPKLPWSVGIRFSHAALQAIAEDDGVDLLHIKGPAVDASLGGAPRESIDADVLVRPAHVGRLIAAMHAHGWETQYRFEDGSAFEHASTMVHRTLAPVDVHRRFPGIDAEAAAAFDRLWADRGIADIAGMPCPVPSIEAQRLILVLHAARNGALDHPDIERAWRQTSTAQRQEVDHLARDLGAEVALAAGTGRLHDHEGEHAHELWRVLSTADRSLVRLWLARVRAAPNRRQALRLAVRLVIPNRRRMQARLGRRPTTLEMLTAYRRVVGLGVRELTRWLARRNHDTE